MKGVHHCRVASLWDSRTMLWELDDNGLNKMIEALCLVFLISSAKQWNVWVHSIVDLHLKWWSLGKSWKSHSWRQWVRNYPSDNNSIWKGEPWKREKRWREAGKDWVGTRKMGFVNVNSILEVASLNVSVRWRWWESAGEIETWNGLRIQYSFIATAARSILHLDDPRLKRRSNLSLSSIPEFDWFFLGTSKVFQDELRDCQAVFD